MIIKVDLRFGSKYAEMTIESDRTIVSTGLLNEYERRNLAAMLREAADELMYDLVDEDK